LRRYTHAPAQWAIPSFAAEQVAAFAFTSGSTVRKPNVKTGGPWWPERSHSVRDIRCLCCDGAVLGTVAHQHIFGFESTIILPLQHGLPRTRAALLSADICECLENLRAPHLVTTDPLRALLADAMPAGGGAASLCDSALAGTARRGGEARFSAPLWNLRLRRGGQTQ